MASPSVAVVYLVRAAEGLEPLQQFLAAYQAHPAACEHDLILVYKGFPDHQVPEEVRSLFASLPAPTRSFFMDDAGYDLTAYFLVRDAFEHEFFFFMNTFSQPLAAGWLHLIMTHLARPEVGIAGCTGSWQSIGLKRFPPFPNPHLRSNAFGISKNVLRQIRFDGIKNKMDAYRLESGIAGITAQVAAMGLQTVLTGRDGMAYLPHDWWRSGTFRQAEQENLLVADNQTWLYENAGGPARQHLSLLAWGEKSTLAGVRHETPYIIPPVSDPDGSVTREIQEMQREAHELALEHAAQAQAEKMTRRMKEKAQLKAQQAHAKDAAARLKKRRRDRSNKASRKGVKGFLYRLLQRFTPDC